MTTAARPTFDPAKGKNNKNPTLQYSSRDLASHTKLKFRQDGQGTENEFETKDFREQLIKAEQVHFDDKKQKQQVQAAYQQHLTPEQRLLLEKTKNIDADETDSNRDDSSGSENSDSEADSDSDVDDEEDDNDDDTAELLKELEKIKKERELERHKQEMERLEEEEREREENAMLGNPLLNFEENTKDFTVKRRWDDDVIFKNQARGTDDKPKKRFVNDLLRSDFHRKFMSKYIR